MGCSSVIMGAFGAHWIKSHLGPDQYAAYRTAVEYLFYNTLIVLILSLVKSDLDFKRPMQLFIAGTILFSCSIFILSTKEIHHGHVPFLGPITPLGGLCMIFGWVNLILIFKKQK